jgi:hypothetical protein
LSRFKISSIIVNKIKTQLLVVVKKKKQILLLNLKGIIAPWLKRRLKKMGICLSI